jgi:hypothetical protein
MVPSITNIGPDWVASFIFESILKLAVVLMTAEAVFVI